VYCGTDPNEHVKTIEQRKIKLRKYSIDVVFCIDCTCSMAPVMDSIKENIIKFIDVCNDSSVDWRARIVLFRDSAVDKEWLVNDKPFVSKKDELVTQLDSALAKGNIEDEKDASSSYDALFYAATQSEWRNIRFPGGPMDSDWDEFLKSGGRYGFEFIVGFTDSNIRPYTSKTLEEIEKYEQCEYPYEYPYYRFKILLYAPKRINHETGRSSCPKGWDFLRYCILNDFEDAIEFYYHKELDFSPIYSILSQMYT